MAWHTGGIVGAGALYAGGIVCLGQEHCTQGAFILGAETLYPGGIVC